MPRILAPRNLPMQQRALEKREMILSVTAKLLGTVGQDDLTTILLLIKRVYQLALCITIFQTSTQYYLPYHKDG